MAVDLLNFYPINPGLRVGSGIEHRQHSVHMPWNFHRSFYWQGKTRRNSLVFWHTLDGRVRFQEIKKCTKVVFSTENCYKCNLIQWIVLIFLEMIARCMEKVPEKFEGIARSFLGNTVISVNTHQQHGKSENPHFNAIYQISCEEP